MKRYTGILVDSLGNPKLSQTVQVVYTGSSALAPLYLNGVPISNPLTTDAVLGTFAFDVFSGTYDFLDATGNALQQKVQIYDMATLGEWLNASKVPLSSTAAPQYTDVRSGLEALLAGTFNTGILPVGTGITLAGEQSGLVYAKRFTIPYTGVAVGATTFQAALITLPANVVLMDIQLALTTTFTALGTGVNIAFGYALGGSTLGTVSISSTASSWVTALSGYAGPPIVSLSKFNTVYGSAYGFLPVSVGIFIQVQSSVNLSGLAAGSVDAILTYMQAK